MVVSEHLLQWSANCQVHCAGNVLCHHACWDTAWRVLEHVQYHRYQTRHTIIQCMLGLVVNLCCRRKRHDVSHILRCEAQVWTGQIQCNAVLFCQVMKRRLCFYFIHVLRTRFLPKFETCIPCVEYYSSICSLHWYVISNLDSFVLNSWFTSFICICFMCTY